MSSLGIIFEEPPQRCESCAMIEETPPYGLHHEDICFACAMKDPTLTEIRMKELLFGEED